MKIRIIFRLFFLLLLTAVTVQKSSPQSQRELLELAYTNNDYNLLDTFFIRWQKENNAISKEKFENLSDIEKDIYNIYYTCYRPLDLKSIKWGYEEYSNKGCKYLVLHNSIKYEIIKTLDPDSLYDKYLALIQMKNDTAEINFVTKYKNDVKRTDTPYVWRFFSFFEHITKSEITEFYPYSSYNNLITVYETEFYKTILSSFLWNNKYSDYKYPGLSNIKISNNDIHEINTELEKRRKFLNKVVRTAERGGCSFYTVGAKKHFSKYPFIQLVQIDEMRLFPGCFCILTELRKLFCN